MNDIIKMKDSNEEVYDKKQIALAIRNSTLNDTLNCSIKTDKIISTCEKCPLKFICDGIDKLSTEYTLKTSTTIKDFTF